MLKISILIIILILIIFLILIYELQEYECFTNCEIKLDDPVSKKNVSDILNTKINNFDDVQKNNTEYDVLTRKLNDNDVNIDDIKTNIEIKKSDINTLNDNIYTLDHNINRYYSSLSLKDTKSFDLKTQYDNLISSIKNIGLCWKLIDGYPNDNINYFDNKPIVKKGYSSHINNINFVFNNSNQGSVERTTYGLEFTGFFRPSKTGKWTFTLISDDMSYMWLDDKNTIFIDNRGLHGMRSVSNNKHLNKDTLYPIKIQFGENGGGDNLILRIIDPDGIQIIHSNEYFINGLYWKLIDGYPNDNINYFNNKPIVRKGYSSHINNINFVFNYSNQGSVERTTYGLEFTGFFRPSKTGIWKFTLISDDMSYMWLDDINRLFIDNRGQHGMKPASKNKQLKKDKLYPIKIQFGENGGGDNLILRIIDPDGKQIKHSNEYFYNFKNDDKNIENFNTNIENFIMDKNNIINNIAINYLAKETLKENINNDIFEKKENNKTLQSEQNMLNTYQEQYKYSIDIPKKIKKNRTEYNTSDSLFKNNISENIIHFTNLLNTVIDNNILPIVGWTQQNEINISTLKHNDGINWNNCYIDKNTIDLNEVKKKYNNNDVFMNGNNIEMSFSKKGSNPIHYIY